MFSSLDNINISKYFIIFLCMIIIWLIFSYITMRIIYKPLYEWWAQNGGDKYKDKLSITSLASANYSTILYNFDKLFRGPLNQLNINQVRFIIGQLFPFLRYVKDKTQYGIITPKSMCETVKLSSDDNDQLFDNFLQTYKRQDTIIKEGAPLQYIQMSVKKDSVPGGKYYRYVFAPNTGDDVKYSGVYPKGTEDTVNWSGLILEWLNGGDYSEDAIWGLVPDADNLLQPFVVNPPDDKKTYKYWFENDTGRGDNFLARMSILPNAPLVVYFINNQYSTQGMKVDAQAFKNLISPAGGSIAGGWVGYLNGSSDQNYDYFTNTIRTTTDFPMPPPPPQCTKPNVGNGILSGVLSAISIGSMVLFLPEGAALWPVVGAALLSGGISGYQAGKGTC